MSIKLDYNKLHWYSDWMYSELFGGVDESDDVVVGLYAIKDFPNIHMYIDMENQKIIDAWIDN